MKTMFISLFVLSVLASVVEALREISSVIAPVMRSQAGILITGVVAAYLAYRWYRARHMS